MYNTLSPPPSRLNIIFDLEMVLPHVTFRVFRFYVSRFGFFRALLRIPVQTLHPNIPYQVWYKLFNSPAYPNFTIVLYMEFTKK